METMRVVEANPFFFPSMGGIERRMHVTAKHLSRLGHDVTVLTAQLPGTPSEEESEDGYRIVRIPSKFYNIYNPPYVITHNVTNYLDELKPDIVDYNYRWAPSFDSAVAKYSGTKIFTYHNMWGEGRGAQGAISGMNDCLYRKKLDTYNHIMPVTEFVRQDLIKHGVDPAKMTAIDNCLDEIPPLCDEKGDFILSLGRLVDTKGLTYLIEAMRSTNCKLVLCGTGPEEKKLRKMISKYGLGDRIEIKGWVSEEEKARLMGTCRFFVMPSLYESYGLAALEALSYGKPIVCTDVDGLPGNVKGAGYYVKPKDSKGLADAINRLNSDEDLRQDLSKKAIKVSREVTWDTQILKVEKLFKDVINGDVK